MTDRKLVYIASPYAGDIEYNTRMAIEYCRYAVGYGVVPLAPHLLLPRFLYELNPEERELGIQMGLQLLSLCSELWVFGSRISDGMSREIAEAQKLGIPVKYIGKIEMTGVKDMQYGIWAKRSAASVCGAAEAWLKSDGKPITFDTYEEAAEKAKWYMENLAFANVSYYPREMSQEMDEAPAQGMYMKL